jgi:glutamine amidotransferase
VIAIIDYGMGNLRSVQKGLERVGGFAEVVSTPEPIEAADKIVLPGVGAFGDAMNHLQERNLIDAIQQAVTKGKPFLGICLGLQLLFETSYEEGRFQGLGIVPGEVVRFDFNDAAQHRDLKIPHMGWNQVRFPQSCPLVEGVDDGSYFYFVHSYHVVPTQQDVIAGVCDYGGDFTAMIWQDNVFATQFHPEKSQAIGLRILENFARL